MTTVSVPGALAQACQAVRPAGPRDVVAGVVPDWVASPASVAEASALLAAATEHGLAVVPRGSGTAIGWGPAPRRCDLVIDTLRLDQVLEHAAGDLVVQAQAGVTMARLAEVLAAAGQQLAVDVPPGVARNGSPTVGGLLATGAAGPRRLRYGTPRDLVIGVTVVRADGTVTKSGGKVVKNVAGYDLGKLYTGSCGTLGLITEATFRLHPLPTSAAYVTAGYADPAAAAAAASAAAGSDLAPTAVELDRPAVGGLIRLGVLLEGDPEGVAERASLMRDVLGAGTAVSDTAPGWWGGPAAAGAGPGSAGPGGPTLIQVSFWAAALPGVLAAVDQAAGAAGLDPALGGSPAAGVLQVAVVADAPSAAVASFLAELRAALATDLRPGDPRPEGPPARGSAVVLTAAPAVRDRVDMWGPVPALSLMRAVKDRFDPGYLMAPGRFAGGI